MNKVQQINKSGRGWGITLATISSATFGLIPFFSIPVMASGVCLNSLCFYRFLFASSFLGLFMLLTGKSLKISLKELGMMFLLSIVYGMTSMALTYSYDYMPSSVATTIHFLYPIAVAIMMIVFFKEKVSWKIIGAALLAVLGVYLLCGSGASGEIQMRGLIAVFITIFTYSTFLVGVNKSFISKMDGMKMTFYVLFCSAVLFFINILIQDGGHIDKIPDTISWVRLLLLALFPTLISDMTVIYAIKIIGSTTAAILGCMEPLTAVTIGIVVFGEQFRTLQIFGAFAIFVAVCIVIFNKKSN